MKERTIFDPVRLSRWCEGRWQGPIPDRVMGIGNDSRVIQAGELYVALRGERHDGHAFVVDALQRSACAALVDSSFASSAAPEWPLLVVPDTRRALMDMARGHRNRCQAEIIGITGSVGKTTVKELTADILARIGSVTRTQGNWNNDIGLPLSLLRMQPDDRFGVFEVGMNHPGELRPLCDILRPSWGIITPIGPAHLAQFESVEAIAEEKASLLDALPENGMAVLSLDDRWYEKLLGHVRSRVLRLSLNNPQADYRGAWQARPEPTLTVWEGAGGTPQVYRLPLPGQYMADNALRAIVIGLSFGASPEVIADALYAYRPLSMRWNTIRIAGIAFINDAYNANPMSMRAAVDALQEMPGTKRKWLVVSGMLELGSAEKDEHDALGRYVAQFPWAGVLTIGPLGALIAQGARDAGLEKHTGLHMCEDAAEAAERLKDEAQVGDVVLLKASRGERIEDVVTAYEDLLADENGVIL